MKTLKFSNLVIFLFFIAFIGCKNEIQKKVAILKYATHPALDELENSFIKRLDSLILTDPELKGCIIEKYNANGNQQTAKSISESFNYKGISLILAIATPAAMAVSNTPSNIPLIYGAVADPTGAKIIPSVRATGIQNAGENIIIDALNFIKRAFPNVKKIGTLYNPAEQNSLFVQKYMEINCKKMGIELKQVTVNNSSQFAGITEYLCKDVDVIYSANDNTVNAGVTSIVSVCNKMNKPFIIGDLSTLSKGPLFAIGLQYESMGNDLADIAYSLLNGKSISDFKPQSAPKPQIWMNLSTMNKIHYVISDSLLLKDINKSIK